MDAWTNASAPGGFVRYIPWPMLPHWHDELFEDALKSPDMLAAHLWRRTGDGAAATRIRIAYERGLYADAAAPVVARYLLREAAERNASLGVLPPPGQVTSTRKSSVFLYARPRRGANLT